MVIVQGVVFAQGVFAGFDVLHLNDHLTLFIIKLEQRPPKIKEKVIGLDRWYVLSYSEKLVCFYY